MDDEGHARGCLPHNQGLCSPVPGGTIARSGEANPTTETRSPVCWRNVLFVRVVLLVAAAWVFACGNGCKRDRGRAPEQKKETAAMPSSGSERVKLLIQRLQSQEGETRRGALAELQGGSGAKRSSFSVAESVELLRAATMDFPGTTAGLWDTPTWIIAAVADEPRVDYLPVLKEIFPRLGPSARERALDLLSGIDDAGAAETFISMLKEHATEISSPPPLIRLQRQPHHPDILFPRLLELATNAALADDIYLTTLAYCEKGLLPAARIAGHTDPLLAAYRNERDWLVPRQAGKGDGWLWEEDYQERRNKAALLLDLFGHLSLQEVEADLLQALDYRDARLVYFSLASLLRHAREVPPRALDLVAASPEMRNSLYEKLKGTNRMELFPKRFLTQEAFAESEMVRWLVYPAELGRAPDEIELKKVVAADTGGPDGVLDYYVFRFRTFNPHWAAKNGWTAGVAGPFLRKDAPSPVAYGGTFSKFESWDAKKPEEHVGDIRQLLKEWAQYHARERGEGKK